MAGPVMVGIVTAKAFVFINIPCSIVITPVQAVTDIAAFDFLIVCAPSVPQVQDPKPA